MEKRFIIKIDNDAIKECKGVLFDGELNYIFFVFWYTKGSNLIITLNDFPKIDEGNAAIDELKGIIVWIFFIPKKKWIIIRIQNYDLCFTETSRRYFYINGPDSMQL